MATEIFLTDGAIRVTAAPTKQLLAESLDVSKFDQADLILQVFGMEGTPTGSSFVVTILGGMSRESEEGWPALGQFLPGVTSIPKSLLLHLVGLVKFIRWQVDSLPASVTGVTFSIRGMARTN